MDDLALPGWTRSSNARGGYSYRYDAGGTYRMVEQRRATGEWAVYEWEPAFGGWSVLDMTFDDPTAAMAWATVELSNG